MLIGVIYTPPAGPFTDSLGVKQATTGDQQGFTKAVVGYINQHGGVGGRPLQVLFAPRTAQDSVTNLAAAEQRLCATLTEDNHVLAVMSLVNSSTVLQSCLAQHRVPFVEDNFGFPYMNDAALSRYMFVPSYPDPTRAMNFFVDSLVADGFFGTHPVIGLIRAASQTRDLEDKALHGALSRHGLQVADEESITTPDQEQGAALHMKTNHVTHVIPLEGSGGLETLFFMEAAEGQLFRPRYAIDTQDGPDLLASNAPSAQLKGAHGIGWIPTVDTGHTATSPANNACLQIIRTAGLTTPDSTATRFALATCDVMFFFSQAASGLSNWSPDGFARAGEALGASYTPTGSFRSFFSAARHDGTSAYGKLSYGSACSCFAYDSAAVISTG